MNGVKEASYVAALMTLSCSPSAKPTSDQQEPEMSETTAEHPGEIVNEDKITGRVWTVKASEVPETIAWVDVNGVREPVVRIEITGTPEHRRITKFGRDGQMLESTIQAPPPR